MDSSPPPVPPLTSGTPLASSNQADPATTPALETENAPVAGPSTTPAQPAPKRNYRRPKQNLEGLLSYTSAFVPGLYNIKNPAGDFVQRDSNVEVTRQVSQARVKRQKVELEEEKQRLAEQGQAITEPSHPLAHTLIIHPGSRNLRFGRASDFYPQEVPNCIARPANAVNRGRDPPVPGSRAKRLASEQIAKGGGRDHRTENGEMEMNWDVEDENEWVDPLDTKIGYLRDYLRTRLRQNRLSTDWKDGSRVTASNAKVRPEALPEHTDPYRIDWTELEARDCFVGTEALRLPDTAGFRVRYPILNRTLNTRDWKSPQLLMDDIAVIMQESLRTELGILQKDYHNYSVVLLVPDHGDRIYVQEMTNLMLTVMGFKEIAVHQEAYAAIFSAGMSSACVVDIGAEHTSVTCVDEGNVNADTRIVLNYGGDAITAALTALLERSSFPYRELDLAKSQEWLMMDNLKIKICTLEEHMVASTPWDFYVLKTEGLTQKYIFRTYDENILAPLCFFDTRMIDFDEKRGEGRYPFRNTSEDIDDMLTTTYDEPTGAMRDCTAHLFAQPVVANGDTEPTIVANGDAPHADKNDGGLPVSNGVDQSVKAENGDVLPGSVEVAGDVKAEEFKPAASTSATPTPVPTSNNAGEDAGTVISPNPAEDYDVVYEASKVPLDAAIAASISVCGTENKVKAAASTILLIGGSSALKGLGAFIAERLPPLLRQKNLPIQDVQIVPPPRNLNPRFVSWKGASVMCNLESLSDMWIRRDEWEAIGPRALKERYMFL